MLQATEKRLTLMGNNRIIDKADRDALMENNRITDKADRDALLKRFESNDVLQTTIQQAAETKQILENTMTAADKAKQTLSPIITDATTLKESTEEKVVALCTNAVKVNVSRMKGAITDMQNERGKMETTATDMRKAGQDYKDFRSSVTTTIQNQEEELTNLSIRYKKYTDLDQTRPVQHPKTDDTRLTEALKSCADVLTSCKKEQQEAKTSRVSCSRALKQVQDCEQRVSNCKQQTMNDEFNVRDKILAYQNEAASARDEAVTTAGNLMATVDAQEDAFLDKLLTVEISQVPGLNPATIPNHFASMNDKILDVQQQVGGRSKRESIDRRLSEVEDTYISEVALEQALKDLPPQSQHDHNTAESMRRQTDSLDSLDGVASISTRDGDYLYDLSQQGIDGTQPQITNAPQVRAQFDLQTISETDELVDKPEKKWDTTHLENDGLRRKQPSDSTSQIPNDSQASDRVNTSAPNSETDMHEDITVNSTLAHHAVVQNNSSIQNNNIRDAYRHARNSTGRSPSHKVNATRHGDNGDEWDSDGDDSHDSGPGNGHSNGGNGGNDDSHREHRSPVNGHSNGGNGGNDDSHGEHGRNDNPSTNSNNRSDIVAALHEIFGRGGGGGGDPD